MKLQNEIEEKDNIQVEKIQFERKLKLEKTLIPKENHKAFEYNLKTGELHLKILLQEITFLQL